MDYARIARYAADAVLDDKDKIELAVPLLVDLLHERDAAYKWRVPNLPRVGESVAVTTRHFKMAALAFDRVWSLPPLTVGPPAEIAAYAASEPEIWLEALVGLLEPDSEAYRRLSIAPPDGTPLELFVKGDLTLSIRAISDYLSQEFKFHATPIFGSVAAREAEYRPGARELVAAVLNDVAVVDETALSWEQVTELRQDKEAVHRYRRFVRWLDQNFEGNSIAQIEDDLLLAMESYDYALKKHGVSTVLGTIEALVDPKFVAGAAALFAGVAVGGSVLAGTGTVIALSIGRLACTLSRELLDQRELRRAEVAYAVELRDLVQK